MTLTVRNLENLLLFQIPKWLLVPVHLLKFWIIFLVRIAKKGQRHLGRAILLSETFSTVKRRGRSTPPSQKCQHEKAEAKAGLPSRRVRGFWGMGGRHARGRGLSSSGWRGEAVSEGEGEGPPGRRLCQGSWGTGWRSCPDARPGVALALPNRLPARAQERRAVSPRVDWGWRFRNTRRVRAWCAVIRTFLSAWFHLWRGLFPLFGIN